LKKIGSIVLLSAALAACAGMHSLVRLPRAPDAGVLVVYIDPFPGQAERLMVALAELTAVREDGGTAPLRLELDALAGGSLRRQRLLARADLPAGRYAGFDIRVGAAELGAGEGRAALAAPDGPVRISAPYTVSPGRAAVLVLRLVPSEALRAGFLFEPVFDVLPPAPIAAGLIACATGRGSDSVTLFDKVTGQVSGVVLTGRGPTGIAVDNRLRRAYVALAEEDGIEVIDLLEARRLDIMRLASGDAPSELVLTPDGRTLVCANPGSNTVSLVDARGLFERQRVQVGNGPESVLVDPAGRRAFVFNTLSDSISVIDVPAGTVVGSLGTESGPFRGRFDPAGTRLYVIHHDSPYLTIVDPRALTVSGRVYVGAGASAIEVDPRTGRIYLARLGAAEIAVYDPTSLLPIDTIASDGEVGHLALDPATRSLYAVLTTTGAVRRIGLDGKQAQAETDVGGSPYQVAFSGER
jgi:YVTN family beta-propeller protein